MTDRAGANEVLPGFLDRFNERFARPAELETPAWRPAPPEVDLARICAFRWRRAVGNDNTIRLEGAVIQLPPAAGRSLAGRLVEVELRLEGRLVVLIEGRPILAIPAPSEPRRLRDVRLPQADGPPPAPGGDRRPGYKPRPAHPWNRPGPKAPYRGLTESLSR